MATKKKAKPKVRVRKKLVMTDPAPVVAPPPPFDVEEDSYMTKITDWVKDNPWKSAGIGVAILMVLAYLL